jgi:hypothetical protein
MDSLRSLSQPIPLPSMRKTIFPLVTQGKSPFIASEIESEECGLSQGQGLGEANKFVNHIFLYC